MRRHTKTLTYLLTYDSGKIDFKEFLLAINITSAGKPEQKLEWAFQMCFDSGLHFDLHLDVRSWSGLSRCVPTPTFTLTFTLTSEAGVGFPDV